MKTTPRKSNNKFRAILSFVIFILIVIALTQFWLFELFSLWFKSIVTIIIFTSFLFVLRYLNKRKGRGFKNLLTIILALLLGYANTLYLQANLALINMMISTRQQHVVEIVVLKTSPFNKIGELKNKSIGLQSGDTLYGYIKISESLEESLTWQINKDYQAPLYDSYILAYEALLSGSIDSMALSLEHVSAIREKYPDILDHIRVLKQFKYPMGDLADRVDIKNKSFNVLITGVDVRIEDGLTIKDDSRVDTVILATVNPKTHKVVLTSLPRDLIVPVSCANSMEDKLTHVGNNGMECLIDTVEKFLEVDINYFVKFNFFALVDLVNTLGGVDVDVLYNFCEQDSHDNPDSICVNAGYQSLNGEDALAYARHRRSGNDYARGGAQKQIIEAVVRKIASINGASKLPSILSTISENMLTNLSRQEMYDGISLAGSGAFEFESLMVEGDGIDAYFIELYGNYAFAHVADPDALTTLIQHLHSIYNEVPTSTK